MLLLLLLEKIYLSNAVNTFEKKITGKRVLGAGKGFTLFIWNEDMHIIKIKKSLEDSNALIDGVTEAVNMK